MKRILIIAIVVIGLLVSLYGVSYVDAVDGVVFSVEKISTALNKLSDFILPNQFQPEYLDTDEDWLTTEHSGVVPLEYMMLLGYNPETDILHENAYNIDRILSIGFLKSTYGEYMRLARTYNEETFSIYIGRDEGFEFFGESCMAIGINGLHLYVYKNREELYNNSPSYKLIGQVWSSELDYNLETMIKGGWID